MSKIIFCDLDGTLLNDDKSISPINLKYIEKAIKNNCRFVISSGRSNMSVDYYNKLLEFNKIKNYAIAFNGAYIYRTDTNEKLAEHLIEGNIAIKAINLCKKFKVDIMVYRDELLWFDTYTERISMYAKRNMVNTIKVNNINIVTENPVSKVIIIGDNDELKKVEEEVFKSGINKIMTTFFSAANLYEFNPFGIDKGTGIRELSSILNVNIKDTIAIGDNYNDLSMIKAAGIGVCCSNGEDGVKLYSDYITENDNNKGAVAEVIKKFVLYE